MLELLVFVSIRFFVLLSVRVVLFLIVFLWFISYIGVIGIFEYYIVKYSELEFVGMG